MNKPKEFGKYIRTDKLTIIETYYENSTNISVDLMELGNNEYLAHDEYTQRLNRFHRAISKLDRMSKHLKESLIELEEEHKRGLKNEFIY